MKKLLFITTRLFWPTDSGRKVSLYYYCKGLHEQYDYDIYVYSFLEAGQNNELLKSKPDFIKDVKIAYDINKATKMRNLFIKSVFCGWPFQNAIFYSKKNCRAIKQYCEQINPDVVMVDMIRLAPYWKAIQHLECKRILDLDDMLSKRYKRQAKSSEGHSSLFGVYSNSSSKWMDNGFIKRVVLKSESKRIAKAELIYGKLFDRVIFVSQVETDEYNKILLNKAVTVRIGVDYGYYSQPIDVEKMADSLVFLGNLKVAQNIESLDIIINKILPRLDVCKLYVVGAMPTNLSNQYDDNRVIFCGQVADVRPIVEQCKVFLAPIPYGTGIKTKVIEAMAMGMPVITNNIGAEGIEAVNGQDFIVEDDMDQMVAVIKKLLQDNKFCESMGKNAQRFIEQYYDWNIVYKSFEYLGL